VYQTLLNKQIYDLIVLNEIWSQVTEAEDQRTTIRYESCSSARQAESTTQAWVHLLRAHQECSCGPSNWAF